MNKRIETIPTEAMAALSRYHWPGNIRELENFIERAVILSRGETLDVPLAELKRRTTAAAPVETDGTADDARRCRARAHPAGARTRPTGWSAVRPAPPRDLE